jgi:AraC-like DNA-binding protein
VERIIPDGCIDVLFTEGELIIAGPDTQGVELPAEENRSFVGVRFRAGVGPAALKVPASTLADRRVLARDVLGNDVSRLTDELAAAASVREAALRLEMAAAGWLRTGAPDGLITNAVSILRTPRADYTLTSLADTLGVSERQLRRRFVAAVGYGPKLLERVLRLRRFIAAARGKTMGLAALALEAGYADQPHLTRECRELTGITPTQLLGYPVTAA